MNRIRVLLAEDHTLVRAGFRALLEKLVGLSARLAADPRTAGWRARLA